MVLDEGIGVEMERGGRERVFVFINLINPFQLPFFTI